MDDQVQLPVYATELIDLLDDLFPHRTPSMKDTDRHIFEYAGRRNLVDYLLELKRQEQYEGVDPTEDIIK